jgi:hypothetical protein
VDHLDPLELGGFNDIKNLWPEPVDPWPGSYEKDGERTSQAGLSCVRQVQQKGSQARGRDEAAGAELFIPARR